MDLGGGSVRVVAAPTSERVILWVGFPLAGAAGLWLLGVAIGWLFDLAAIPFGHPFHLLHALGESTRTPLTGLGFGLAHAYFAHRRLLTVIVSPYGTTLRRNGGAEVDVLRPDVDAVFLDGDSLVLLDANGAELARESSDLSADALREAFTANGFPWRADGDPHRDEFRLWAEDLPGVPTEAAPLLLARAKALKGNRRRAAALRKELLGLGVIIRDEDRLQYFRTTPGIGR
jgi:hypothetical protein